jgi:hypothetical protein
MVAFLKDHAARVSAPTGAVLQIGNGVYFNHNPDQTCLYGRVQGKHALPVVLGGTC